MDKIIAFIGTLMPFILMAQTPLFQTGYTTINSIAVSQDGKTMAVEGDASDITLWDLGSRKKIITLERNKAASKAEEEDDEDEEIPGLLMLGASSDRMYFTKDGQRLILTSSKGAVVWNTKQAKPLYEIKATSDFYDIDSEKKYIAVLKEALKKNQTLPGADIRGSQNRPKTNTIILYDIQSGNEQQLKVSSLSITKRIRFVPESSNILVAGLKGNLTLIDYMTAKSVDIEPMYDDDEEDSAVGYDSDDVLGMFGVSTIAVHPSKQIVASCDSKSKVHIYDFKEQKLLSTVQLSNMMSMPGQGLERLEFSPNGKFLVGASTSISDKGMKKQIRFWDVKNGKEIKSIFIDAVMSGFTFSAEGKYLALTKMDSVKKTPFVISIFDANTLTEIETFQGRGIPSFFPNDTKRMAYSLGSGIGVFTIK